MAKAIEGRRGAEIGFRRSTVSAEKAAAELERHRHRLANEIGVPVHELSVLAHDNDPFTSGTPTDLAKAQWAADLAHEYDLVGQAHHLRGLHYALVAHNATKRDGGVYEGTLRTSSTSRMRCRSPVSWGCSSFADRKSVVVADGTTARMYDEATYEIALPTPWMPTRATTGYWDRELYVPDGLHFQRSRHRGPH